VEAPLWIEIEIRRSTPGATVSARTSIGERTDEHTLGAPFTLEALAAITRATAAAVEQRKPLSTPLVAELQHLHAAVFQGAVRDLFMRLQGSAQSAQNKRILVRFTVPDRSLAALPWEALCEPNTSLGFVGSSPHLSFARTVAAPDPITHREVRGAFRILAVAPLSDADALRAIERALAARIAEGAVEWLDPIVGPRAQAGFLFKRLRVGPSPHVIHFLGHGAVDKQGDAILQLADAAGEAAFLKVEILAQELAASFAEGAADALRLVYLESCEGARAGERPSAAELFVKAGAAAVVANEHEVDAPLARAASRDFYLTLTEGAAYRGDVAAALNGVRRTLLASFDGRAEAFSPRLHLRGPSSVLFDFEGRKLVPPRAAAAGAAALAPALRKLLDAPFSLLLGDTGEDHDGGHKELRAQLESDFAEDGDDGAKTLPLTVLAQRHALRFGHGILGERFQEVLGSLLQSDDAPVPRGVAALAKRVRPGVHVTLLWLPVLEQALAAAHPDRTIHVVQLPAAGTKRPLVVRRLAGTTEWKTPLRLPKELDVGADLVVLRLYGGYAPNRLVTQALLTEDEHFQSLISLERVLPPDWVDTLLGALRAPTRPALFAGLAVLEKWRHRMLLRGLFDEKQMTGSVALLGPRADKAEEEVWQSGESLPIKGSVATVRASLESLAEMLAALPALEER
jgi:CHAT domain